MFDPLFSSPDMARLVVLASTSPYRRELLARLRIPFETASPETDESMLLGESPAATAQRLAEAKARAVVQRYPDALIIGSDQVAANGSERFGKPGKRENAITQLRLMRGKEVVFHTGLCVLDSATNRIQVCCVDTHVGFRDYSDAEIESYLDQEDALNCAGSAKSEGLGISLLRYLRGDDPNALVGLPLIALCEMLRAEDLSLP
jgi:septum formation protein